MNSSPRPAQRSGVLLVDKPAGITSADLTNALKDKFRIQRVGHGGTLDPFATGLMVVLIGEATKVARFLLEGDKEYEAVATLGSETDTGDFTGEVVNKSEVPELALADWQEFAKSWTGTVRQTPPAYSAIKVKGKPLYEYARNGEEVEVPTREVTIREFEIKSSGPEKVEFRVLCSGGTYVRALAADLAMAAGTSAHLSALRRTASSSFRVKNALPLDSMLKLSLDELPVRPLEEALAHLPQVSVNEILALKIRQGNLAAFEALRGQIDKPGYFLVLDSSGPKPLPVAVCNHHPMMRPSCTIERVFDQRLSQT